MSVTFPIDQNNAPIQTDLSLRERADRTADWYKFENDRIFS